MTKSTKLTPPEETNVDKVWLLAESFVNELPCGGLATSLVNTFLSKPIEKRKQKWMNVIAETIIELCDSKLDVENLLNNDRFIDAVLTINAMVLKISDEDKLSNYRQILINIAKDKSLTFDQQEIVMSIIEDVSSNQILLLGKILNHREELEFSIPSRLMSTRSEVIKLMMELKVFDDFRHQDNFELILTDLFDNNFIEYHPRSSNNTGQTKNTPHFIKLTPKAKLLLQLLSEEI